MESFKFCFSR
jgi:hypothetical protein